jgi:hypothetical protein
VRRKSVDEVVVCRCQCADLRVRSTGFAAAVVNPVLYYNSLREFARALNCDALSMENLLFFCFKLSQSFCNFSQLISGQMALTT